MQKNKVLLLIFVFLINTLSSQYHYNFSKGEVPSISTPEISKLFRYSEFPNINSIGGVDVEIDVYKINLDGLEIPLKIKYDTKGIKVSDIASDVGLGWNLIYGGNIVKQIKDLKDNSAFYSDINLSCGGFENELNLKTYRISKGYLYESLSDNVLDYQIDSSPDLFIVNAPGLKDKFYFKDKDRKSVV